MPEVGFLIGEDAPTPTNPLGAKGAGESGIMPVGAVLAAAVEEALGEPGVVTQLPLHPDRVQAWAAPGRGAPMTELALLTPWSIGSVEVRNRIIRSSTSETMADEDGFITPRYRALHQALARGGVRLIFTGRS